MKNNLFFVVLFALIIASCNNNQNTENHDEHAHDGEKIQFTSYSNDFEVFAEADFLVVGKTSNVLSHFSHLPSFKALENGSITIRLIVNGKETTQTLEKPTRKGIYCFDITPKTVGKGKIIFDIKNEKGNFQILVPQITVFATEEEADEDFEKSLQSKTNTTVFTKEQSWKIDFCTEKPMLETFGQVIKTTAQVQSAQGDEILISAKTNGMVVFTNDNVLQGKSVSNGQVLFSISGNGLAENNSTVKFVEAQNNYDKSKSDYERAKELVKDKIVSEKDFLTTKNQYENAKVIYESLNKNFNSSGQNISSSMNGFVKQLFVQNGQYVEAGQPLVSISQNKTLVLYAEVQQKYASILNGINSANIRTLNNNQTYTLEQLNGKVLSFGKNANNDNYLIPVSLQIDNIGEFVSGSFVEIYLKTLTNTNALTIPNTSLLEEQGNFFAYVQVTPELFEKREIKIGVSDGVKTEILKGISIDDRIVSKGAMLIKLAQATGTLDAHSGHVH